MLACDRSPYQINAVISHIMENGEEKPIACASCTLTMAEKTTHKLIKKVLQEINSLKNFHQMLYS